MINPFANSTAVNSTILNGTETSTQAVITTTEAPLHDSVRFDWDEAQKQLILGKFETAKILLAKLLTIAPQILPPRLIFLGLRAD